MIIIIPSLRQVVIWQQSGDRAFANRSYEEARQAYYAALRDLQSLIQYDSRKQSQEQLDTYKSLEIAVTVRIQLAEIGVAIVDPASTEHWRR